MKKLKIILINPPHPDASVDRCDTPLGLAYIAACLEKIDCDVRIDDFTGGVDWKIEKADIYGITVYAPTIEISRQIAVKCRTVNPHCCIVVGGAHSTMLPESIDFADSIVIGEGELAMLDLVQDWPDLKPRYSHVLDSNLDLLPSPAYHLVDVHSYSRRIGGKECISILTSKGCPYHCAFCALPPHHRTVKYRSPKAVADEMRKLKAEYGIDKFNFQDDTFTVNKTRLFRLLELIRPLKIGFRCDTRAGLDNPESYRKLKDSGCDIVCMGIESGSQKILDRMNKCTTVEQNMAAIQNAKDAGLRVKAFFVIGFPGETFETIEETKQFIERSKPDEYLVSNFIPYPGTDVWNNPAKYGVTWMNKDFSKYFQIAGPGYGGINISTDVLSAVGFLELEGDFRFWIKEFFNDGLVLQSAFRQ